MTHNKPVLCIVAGPNGSGKTTLTQELLPYARAHWGVQEYINPDEIALSRFGGYTNGAHLNAAKYAQASRERCLTTGTAFLFETVFSSAEKVTFIEKAQRQNFFVRMFFIATEDPMINSARIAARVMANGHMVPIDKIIERYQRSLANLVRCIPFCDYVCVFDNSYDAQMPQTIFRTAKGRLTKRYTAPEATPLWCQSILDATRLMNL